MCFIEYFIMNTYWGTYDKNTKKLTKHSFNVEFTLLCHFFAAFFIFALYQV